MRLLVALALVTIVSSAEGQPLVNGLGGASGLVVSPDGAHVYVASRYDDAVAILRRDATTGALSFVDSVLEGRHVAEGLAGATALAISADGNVLVVAGRGDRTAVFARDAPSGALTLLGANVESSRVRQPSLAIDANGTHAYQVVERAPASLVVSRRTAEGPLENAQTIELSTSGLEGGAVVISRNGAHVYALACNRASDCELETFGRDAQTGMLTSIERHTLSTEGRDAPAMAISPDDEHLYVVLPALKESRLDVFRRDPASGRLTPVVPAFSGASEVLTAGGRMAVTVSPDGTELYVASVRGSALTRLRRDAASGALTVLESLNETDALALPLALTRAVGTSPDGRHVYVASESGAVTAFARGDGALELVGTVFDEIGCSPEPRPLCRPASGPERGKLISRGDRIAWSWSGRGKGPLADFGDPHKERNRFTLCFYPNESTTWPESMELMPTDCPECWQPAPARRLRFRQTFEEPVSERRLKIIKTGGRADVTFRLQQDDVASSGLLASPYALPLTVQLQSESGACLEARYTEASTTTNRTDAFAARAVGR